MFHKNLLDYIVFEGTAVGPQSPGEAPTQMANGSVLTEPDNGSSTGGNPPDLYQLYPDLAQLDVTNPMVLAQYFAQVAQQMQQQMQMQQQQAMVPSLGAVNTPNEFA